MISGIVVCGGAEVIAVNIVKMVRFLPVINKATPKSMANQFKFYPDKNGDYRWRIEAPNGKVVGASTEGFKSLQGAIKNAQANGYQGDGKRNVTRKGDR